MRLVITGTPGTGKTDIALELSKKAGIELFSITAFVKDRHIQRRSGGEWIVDVSRLGRALKNALERKKDIIIEGHLACEVPLKADVVFVLRTHPKTLIKRLKRRGYDKEKVIENVLAEMLDYCTIRAEKNYRTKILELDTTKRTVAESVRVMLDAIKKKTKKIDDVNYRNELLKYLKLM